MIRAAFAACAWLAVAPAFAADAAAACSSWGQRGALLAQDDFDKPLTDPASPWASEIEAKPGSSIVAGGGKLVFDVAGGATLWYKPKLEGDVLITYRRKIIVDGGRNDRLSDLNQFWMASDPDGAMHFDRSGKFEGYENLRMYYVGIGGNTNTTTRLRKYPGDGRRLIVGEAVDPAHLLQPNRDYGVTVEVYHGCTRVAVDGQPWFVYADPQPLTAGWFGLRTTWSRQEVRALRIYRLN